MDILKPQTPFARLVGEALREEPFTLIDVGCGGGLPDPWRAFGARLRALGLDRDSHEIARLQADETNPEVHYRAALIDVGDWKGAGRSPWSRLAVASWLLRQAAPMPASYGGQAEVGSVEASPAISLAQAVADAGFGAVDFIKIDVDGPDYAILSTLGPVLTDLSVLGVGCEVNFVGDGSPDENSLHNIDGWLRVQGFDLFDLSIRRYAMAALPGRSRLAYPAETHIGRPFQGDAVYLRDLCAPEHAAWASRASTDQLIKLAALMSLFGLPDCAAEVLLQFRARLEPVFPVRQGLDLLAAEAQAGGAPPVTYARYMEAHADNDPYFHVQDGAPDSLRSRSSAHAADHRPYAAINLAAPLLHGDAGCIGVEPAKVETAQGQWSYGVEWPIDPSGIQGDIYLRLVFEVQVARGTISLGLLNPDRISFSDEQAVAAADGPVRVTLVTPRSRVVSVMARNLDPSHHASIATVRLVESVLF